MVLFSAEMVGGFHVAHDKSNLHQEWNDVDGVHAILEGVNDK